MRIFVYKEYNDDLAYGEELIKVFASKKTAEAELKARVEKCFGAPWNEVKNRAGQIDTVTADYVSVVSDDGDVSFFIVEEHDVIGDNVPETEQTTILSVLWRRKDSTGSY